MKERKSTQVPPVHSLALFIAVSHLENPPHALALLVHVVSHTRGDVVRPQQVRGRWETGEAEEGKG